MHVAVVLAQLAGTADALVLCQKGMRIRVRDVCLAKEREVGTVSTSGDAATLQGRTPEDLRAGIDAERLQGRTLAEVRANINAAQLNGSTLDGVRANVNAAQLGGLSLPALRDDLLGRVDERLAPIRQPWRVEAVVDTPDVELERTPVPRFSDGRIEADEMFLHTMPGSIAAFIPCADNEPASGSACGVRSESLGIAFVPLSTGPVEACVSFSHFVDVGLNATGQLDTAFVLVETRSTADAQQVLQHGAAVVVSGTIATNDDRRSTPVRVCGTFTFDQPGLRTLRLRYQQTVAANLQANLIVGRRALAPSDLPGIASLPSVRWEVRPLAF